MRTGVMVWATTCLAVVIGVEEPVLTLSLAFADPSSDPDGIKTLITGQARHIFDVGAFALASETSSIRRT